jgi:hypothetical protein
MENIEYSEWVPAGGALKKWTGSKIFFHLACFLEESENVGFCV